MSADEMTPERHAALLAAALHAVAWQLVDYETDTADRGVSEEHYRDALERAKVLLPSLMPPGAVVVAEEPEWETEFECRQPPWNWRACTEDARFCPHGSDRRSRKVTAWVPVKQEGAGDE